MNTKIYVAGPLFSIAEHEFNEKIDDNLRKMGFSTFLPQRDGHLLSSLLSEGYSKEEATKIIFEMDIHHIKNSDIVLFLLDGRVPDEGACVEIGLAYAYGKECIGYKTDSRSIMGDSDNPLIVGALKNRIAKSYHELEFMLKQFIL
ncbi:nucleoside 2-deoxyribosyltransferase [Methanolobus sp.]|uniref:nucleoside 2-deoxyribosyltransferase n=1 Tax=Methanolobus sp. TaxID=1874737 RepID=UPI0025E1271C|nr:nucleoside 2-deoxyribosyltransferase [Methanolobus sp.]